MGMHIPGRCRARRRRLGGCSATTMDVRGGRVADVVLLPGRIQRFGDAASATSSKAVQSGGDVRVAGPREGSGGEVQVKRAAAWGRERGIN